MKAQKSHSFAFTLMEILVVIAIIIVLAAIAYPVYAKIKSSSNKATVLNNMHQLAGQIAPYAAENDGDLPSEDAEGQDDWKVVASPAADTAWYNALLRQMRQKSAGEFAREKRFLAFYTKENFLYFPGATYPSESKKLERPLFAVSMNTKIHRKKKSKAGDDGGKKPAIKLAAVLLQAQTVAFTEQGLPGEPKAHDSISVKDDYDGSPKGSAKSFVARYGDKGVIAFFDGHAIEVVAGDILDTAGRIRWQDDWHTSNPAGIFWTADPKEDPNEKE